MSLRNFGRPTAKPLAARVNLLPPEIEQAKRSSRTRSGIVALAILSVLVVVVATGVTVFLAAAAQARLLAAQNETIQILQQQNEFVEARALAQKVEIIKAAQLTGTLTEIEMQALIRAVDATLPSGVLITSFAIDSGTPIEDFPLPSSPLERPRVATLILTAFVPGLSSIEQWVIGLEALDGFADDLVANVALDEDTGLYEAIITINLNNDLYRGRFAPVDATATTDDQAAGTTEPTPTPIPSQEGEVTQ